MTYLKNKNCNVRVYFLGARRMIRINYKLAYQKTKFGLNKIIYNRLGKSYDFFLEIYWVIRFSLLLIH